MPSSSSGKRDSPRFGDAALRDFGRRILAARGVPEEHGAIVAECLVWANLRGIDSHGITLIPRYLAQLGSGIVDGSAAGGVAVETGSCLVYDGGRGFGQVAAERCVGHAVRLARSSGLALVVARNTNHFGAAGFWGEKIARSGCIGLVMCNGSPGVPPWQGKSLRLGTNPLCVAVPSAGGDVWILDMATTTVALGKLEDAFYQGEETIPLKWGFLDSQGKPTTDLRAAKQGLATPLGGYKGTGLAMAIEILSAGLSGGPMSTEVTVQRIGSKPIRMSHSFIAIDPSRFMPADEMAERMQNLIRMVKSSDPAPGFDEVLVAGEPERRIEEIRRKSGIPLAARLWEELEQTARSLAVEPPQSI